MSGAAALREHPRAKQPRRSAAERRARGVCEWALGILDPRMAEVLEQTAAVGAHRTPDRAPRIGILVVAYNAASTLASVLDRIPKEFRSRITQVFVCDDASDDSTYLVGLGYKQVANDLPLTVIRHRENLGYGGNQKAGYRLAIEHELDIIVLLHGDGQYAPECLEDIIAPLERGECDAVLGSRMMVKGDARKGGMPLYKYVGNRILTRFENALLGTSLSEFHSGYRAYSVKALASIPFDRNSDGFNFDTQVIIQLVDSGKKIIEVPIPTYYGDEICYVNGLRYARDVAGDVVRYRLSKLGFMNDQLGGVTEDYAIKERQESSHAVILGWLERMPPCRVLDLGCSSGLLASRVRERGHHVTGADVLEHPDVRHRVDRFVRADLDQGLPEELLALGPFDVVLAADVLEHLREPSRLLEQLGSVLADDGVLMTSVPNFAHWYARIRTALGLFDYDQRGVLDRGHVRFFTRRSFRMLLRDAGFSITRLETTGLPVEVLTRGGGRAVRTLRRLDRLAVAMRPTLFGYQFVCQCERVSRPSVVSGTPAERVDGRARQAAA
jgi:2-polyprenyl-3-methyl-5-hydroxy-6-metoxy-1,4-benzoquinol methylase